MASRTTALTSKSRAYQVLLDFLSCDERIGLSEKSFASVNLEQESLDRELLSLINKERLATFVASSNHFDELPSELRERILELGLSQARSALVVARELLRLTTTLDEAGIPHAFFKGLVLSQITQGNFAARGGGDIDLLVNSEDVVAAHRALVATGARAGFKIIPANSRAFALFQWVAKELPYPLAFADIDLHWRLVGATGILPETSVLLQRIQSVEICGKPVPTLSQSDALVMAGLTFYFDGCRSLRQLVDFQLLSKNQGTPLDGYHPRVLELVGALRNHSAQVFGVQVSEPHIVGTRRRLGRAISSGWAQSNSRPKNLVMAKYKIPDLFANLVRQASLGKPVRNVIRFTLAIAFDFRGSDFEHDKLVLAKALKRKAYTLIKRVLGLLGFAGQSK